MAAPAVPSEALVVAVRVDWHLAEARRAYAAIRPRAIVMDRLLASSLRTWQLELRDAEATRVEAALEMP